MHIKEIFLKNMHTLVHIFDIIFQNMHSGEKDGEMGAKGGGHQREEAQRSKRRSAQSAGRKLPVHNIKP